MHFTTSTVVASGLLLARAAVAQNYPAFNPDAVENSLKEFWCQQQVAACPLLCNDRETTTASNECYPENLFFSCVCSDGQEPDLRLYSQTIPYFTCSHVKEECVDNCKGAGICGQQCRENKQCGAEGLPQNKTSTKKPTSSKTTTALPDATDKPKEDLDDLEQGFGGKKDEDKDSGANSMFSVKSGLATGIVGLALGFTIFL
ncbi:hypothetical protein BJ508DRAFT_5189 [Ascobolus immersus RN42]|uniref:DUF7707 domain-containing protein n=1 Tax=Ascobolus immersus RN42 TaxID=1160509 RepID=A0A3N4IRE4_ASCIM|nr:hypothetical protein BJ508DRAFT_5189 [Ascobolus immersus RN42]